MPETTPEIGGKIIVMHEYGILKFEIADKLKIDRRNVSRWIKRNEKEENLKSNGKPLKSKCTSNEYQQTVEYGRIIHYLQQLI